MKRFILEQSDDEFYTSHSGLALAGLCINRYSNLSRATGRKMENNGNLISKNGVRFDILIFLPLYTTMARKPRIHYPGAFYHVMLRGNGGQDIFFSDADRKK